MCMYLIDLLLFDYGRSKFARTYTQGVEMGQTDFLEDGQRCAKECRESWSFFDELLMPERRRGAIAI